MYVQARGEGVVCSGERRGSGMFYSFILLLPEHNTPSPLASVKSFVGKFRYMKYFPLKRNIPWSTVLVYFKAVLCLGAILKSWVIIF